jgi:hypothetical protein
VGAWVFLLLLQAILQPAHFKLVTNARIGSVPLLIA